MTDFDPESFINGLNRSIKIGLSFSGGGYRAMLNGAGQLAALDNRTRGGFESGLGGLLQASTYLGWIIRRVDGRLLIIILLQYNIY